MRLMHIICAGYSGGVQRFFERLVTEFAAQGVTQSLALRDSMECVTRLSASDIPVHTYNFDGRMNGLFNFSTKRALRRQAEDFAPDVIMAWQTRAAGFAPTAPGVLVARQGGYEKLKHYRNCRYLIPNAPGIRDHMLAGGWAPGRVRLISNFVSVDLSETEDRALHDTPADAPLLLAAGRFHSNKAFDVLLDTLARLPSAYLWIAGDGEGRDALHHQADALNVAGRVRWLGWREDIGPLLNACSIFVSSARNEALGNAVLEAMYAGVPVVAAAANGPAGIITDGHDGRVVPINDSEALAAAVSQVIADPTLAATLAANGHKTYLDAYSKERVVEQYLKFFSEITGG